uniref:Uncharacterized protein n=1 Tax=Avena sativa TaxID=4498 RepID=A0ACD5XD43_AVESA
MLYYYRIGDAHWQPALCKRHTFCSLIFVKGTLYALIRPDYPIAVVQIHNDSVELSFLGDKLNSHSVWDWPLLWLAECRGELLLVLAVDYSPMVYHVFRWQSGEMKWVRITSLGGCSLFFHRHQFVGCVGPDHPTVPGDYMYFTTSSRRLFEYRLIDGSWHERESIEDYVPMAWVLQSIA